MFKYEMMCYVQLMMPDTLTEESDADDVSGPNTASSVPGNVTCKYY